MKLLDLNCDLGEGEPPARTRALMRWITSANVACGGHAGDASSMRICTRLAKTLKVRLGAHPGSWNRSDQGRGAVQPTPGALDLLLLQQVSALEKVAVSEGGRLHHIKLHGALYHAVEADERLAKAYVRCVAHYWPTLRIYAFAGGRVLREATRQGVTCLAEGFADRAYQADGQLVPRTAREALLEDPSAAVDRLRDLLADRGITATDGTRLPLRIETLCVHGDSGNSLGLLRALSPFVRRQPASRPTKTP